MPQSGQPDTGAQQQGGPSGSAPAGEAPAGQAQSRAEARARAAAQTVPGTPLTGLTRPPVAGELAYESTITAPTEWVPYVYTTAEIQTHSARRGLSVAAVVCGVTGLLAGIFVIWGVPLAFAAVVLALVARFVERRTGGLWLVGLGTGLAGIVLGALWLLVITQVLPAYYG